MSKKLKIGILIVFGLSIGSWLYLSQYKSPTSTTQPEALSSPIRILSDRAEKFSVSSGEGYPIFTKELIADPFKAKEGEEQYFSIWAKDPEGVEKVTATIKTDIEDKVLELQLVEGTEKEGRWEGSWLTENISLNDSYSTEFQNINKNNKNIKSTLFWYLLK